MSKLPEIRLAKHEDLATIESIELEANPTPWTKQALSTSLNSPNQFYVLCVANIVKAYLIGLAAGGEASLLHIVVKKSEQDQGLATQLLSFWLTHLQKKQSTSECWLEVRQSNVVAQKVYQNLGFEQVSVRKGYYANADVYCSNIKGKTQASKEDALIYRLVIQ